MWLRSTESFNDPSADPLRSSGDDHDSAQVPEGHVGCDEDEMFLKLQLVFTSKVPVVLHSWTVGNRALQSGNGGKERKVRNLDDKKKLTMCQTAQKLV